MLLGTTLPDVLYVLTHRDLYEKAHEDNTSHPDEIYSMNITTSAITRMQQEDFSFSRGISSILCQDQFLYAAEESHTVYKCAIKGTGLRLVQKWTQPDADQYAMYTYSSTSYWQWALNSVL